MLAIFAQIINHLNLNHLPLSNYIIFVARFSRLSMTRLIFDPIFITEIEAWMEFNTHDDLTHCFDLNVYLVVRYSTPSMT